MTQKTKLVLVAAAAAGAYYWFVMRKKTAGARPTCGADAFWKTESDPTGYSQTVAASIRQWGGYCAKRGSVDFDFGDALSGGGPITQPWQVE